MALPQLNVLVYEDTVATVRSLIFLNTTLITLTNDTFEVNAETRLRSRVLRYRGESTAGATHCTWHFRCDAHNLHKHNTHKVNSLCSPAGTRLRSRTHSLSERIDTRTTLSITHFVITTLTTLTITLSRLTHCARSQERGYDRAYFRYRNESTPDATLCTTHRRCDATHVAVLHSASE